MDEAQPRLDRAAEHQPRHQQPHQQPQHPGDGERARALHLRQDALHDEVVARALDLASTHRVVEGDVVGEQRFDRIDFNRNGVLTPYEFGVGR